MSQQIINQLEEAFNETIILLSSFNEKDINTVPFKDSWTAAQVGRHLFKSEDGIDTLFAARANLQTGRPMLIRKSLKKRSLILALK